MNWSRSIAVFSGGDVRAHPPSVAPEASVECLDSSEVFYTFRWGMVLIRRVIHVFSFKVWSVAVEPPSLVRTGSIRVSTIFIVRPSRSSFRKEEEGWGMPYYPCLGEFRRSPVSY
jgi:hypothetical protein